MAQIGYGAEVSGHGHKLVWNAVLDDVAHTITLDAVHTLFDGVSPPLGDPQKAQITLILNSGQPFVIDLLTDGGQFDGGAAMIINSGPRVRQNVRLKVSSDRAQLISHSTDYLAPVGA